MNHNNLFLKLMDRFLPLNVLLTLENWFGKCYTCVIWGSIISCMFQLYNTRHSARRCIITILSCLRYMWTIIATIEHTRCGCFYKSTCVSIVMYADDILLLSPSVTAQQDLLHVCESALSSLDLFINPKKSLCMRIGPRCNSVSCDIVSYHG